MHPHHLVALVFFALTALTSAAPVSVPSVDAFDVEARGFGDDSVNERRDNFVVELESRAQKKPPAKAAPKPRGRKHQASRANRKQASPSRGPSQARPKAVASKRNGKKPVARRPAGKAAAKRSAPPKNKPGTLNRSPARPRRQATPPRTAARTVTKTRSAPNGGQGSSGPVTPDYTHSVPGPKRTSKMARLWRDVKHHAGKVKNWVTGKKPGAQPSDEGKKKKEWHEPSYQIGFLKDEDVKKQ